MKMLLVLRHGKSPQGGPDWERPLAQRAQECDIPLIAEFVQSMGVLPEWIVSSDACRARQTAEIFAGLFSPAPEVVLTRELYLVSAHEIAGEVKSLPDSVGTAVVVGHNAGLEMFAEDLVGRNLPDPLKPGGVCLFELNVDSWRDLHPTRSRMVAFVNPRELRD